MGNGYINDFTPTVKTYYKELKKYKPMSKTEEMVLMEKAKNNDLNAKNKILSSNLRFVFDVAKKYKGYGVAMDDLISEGNLGLIYAFDKFDEKKGYKFISYAVWWINFYIKSYIEKNRAKEEHEVSSEEVLMPKMDSQEVDSSNAELIDSTLHSSNEEEEEEMTLQDETKEIISKLLSTLDWRERMVIQHCFGLGDKKQMTLKECGGILGLSQERVRQIKEKTLLKLKSEALLLMD